MRACVRACVRVCVCVCVEGGGGGGECLGKYIYVFCILFSHYLTSCKYYGVTPNWGSSLRERIKSNLKSYTPIQLTLSALLLGV